MYQYRLAMYTMLGSLSHVESSKLDEIIKTAQLWLDRYLHVIVDNSFIEDVTTEENKQTLQENEVIEARMQFINNINKTQPESLKDLITNVATLVKSVEKLETTNNTVSKK